MPSTNSNRHSKSAFNITKDQQIYGALPGYSSLHAFSGQQSFVRRLQLEKVLQRHSGCVNTVQWSELGDLLVSGSDDTQVCIWDYAAQRLRCCFSTGHSANIFCAKFLPASNNEYLITCAGDHLIKYFNINHSNSKEQREMQSFDCHEGRVKKLATEPQNPFLWLSAAEDGTVRQFDVRIKGSASDKILVDLRNPRMTIDMFCIAINQMNPHYFVAGGRDPIVRVFDRRKLSSENQECVKRFCPNHLARQRPSFCSGHITGVAYSKDGTQVLASYSGDNVFLFDVEGSAQTDRPDEIPRKRRKKVKAPRTAVEEKIVGNRRFANCEFSKAIRCYSRAIEKDPDQATFYANRAAALIRIGRRKDLLQALEDCDRAIKLDPQYYKAFFRKADVLYQLGRLSESIEVVKEAEKVVPESRVDELETFKTRVQCMIDHEVGKEEEDEEEEEEERMEEEESDSDVEASSSSSSSSSYTSSPSETDEEYPEESDSSYAQCYSGHCNVRTVKEVSFFGPRSEYVVSGSDDGNLFIWCRKTGKLLHILKGDKHVVNCAQGHPFDCTLATSGIENNVKLWMPTAEEPLPLENIEQILEHNRRQRMERATVPLSFLTTLLQRVEGDGTSEDEEAEQRCIFQ